MPHSFSSAKIELVNVHVLESDDSCGFSLERRQAPRKVKKNGGKGIQADDRKPPFSVPLGTCGEAEALNYVGLLCRRRAYIPFNPTGGNPGPSSSCEEQRSDKSGEVFYAWPHIDPSLTHILPSGESLPLYRWSYRHWLFHRFDEGIQIHADGFMDITPEDVARHIAQTTHRLLPDNCSTELLGSCHPPAFQSATTTNGVTTPTDTDCPASPLSQDVSLTPSTVASSDDTSAVCGSSSKAEPLASTKVDPTILPSPVAISIPISCATAAPRENFDTPSVGAVDLLSFSHGIRNDAPQSSTPGMAVSSKVPDRGCAEGEGSYLPSRRSQDPSKVPNVQGGGDNCAASNASGIMPCSSSDMKGEVPHPAMLSSDGRKSLGASREETRTVAQDDEQCGALSSLSGPERFDEESFSIIEGCCGYGGNTVQFAKVFRHVTALDTNAERIAMARHNAEVYGISDRVDWVTEDAVAWMQRRAVSLGCRTRASWYFASPPWGGEGYKDASVFSVYGNRFGCDVAAMAVTASRMARNIGLYLPPNQSVGELVKLANELPNCALILIDEVSVGLRKNIKYLVAYFIDEHSAARAFPGFYGAVASLCTSELQEPDTMRRWFEWLLRKLGTKAVLACIRETVCLCSRGGVKKLISPESARSRGGVFFSVIKTMYPDAYRELNKLRKCELVAKRKTNQQSKAAKNALSKKSSGDPDQRGQGPTVAAEVQQAQQQTLSEETN